MLQGCSCISCLQKQSPRLDDVHERHLHGSRCKADRRAIVAAALAACKAAGAEEVPAIAHQLLVVSGPEPTVAAAALLVCPTIRR